MNKHKSWTFKTLNCNTALEHEVHESSRMMDLLGTAALVVILYGAVVLWRAIEIGDGGQVDRMTIFDWPLKIIQWAVQ